MHCLPALAALRAARPGDELGFLIEDRHAGLLDGHPHVDRRFVFARRGGARAVLAVRRDVRAWRPDVAIDLQGNLKSALLTRLSGASRRIGLPAGEAREGSHLAGGETVPPGPAGEHRVERALRLVAALTGPLDAATRPAAVLAPVADAARAAVEAGLAAAGARPGGFALIVPGTSDFGAFKRWPAARFGGLAQRLRTEAGLVPLVGFGPGQRPLAEAVVAASGGAARLAPATAGLGELTALLRAAALVVGADSGPVAMAAVAGVPTVALFGPKDPAVYGPPGPRTSVVWKQVYCSPCRLRTCDDPICMTTMEIDEVWVGVRSALGAAAPAGAGLG